MFPHADEWEGISRSGLLKAFGVDADLPPGRGPQSLAFDFRGQDWAQMFDGLKKRYGVWGLARLEAFVRLADHRASEEGAQKGAGFDSLMREETMVGDIDGALMIARRSQYQADYKKMQLHLKQTLARRSNAAKAGPLFWSAEHWVMNRALFGAKRHPLLVGVQSDINDLVKIAAPCRLVYDRSRGGRVNDPVLSHYP